MQSIFKEKIKQKYFLKNIFVEHLTRINVAIEELHTFLEQTLNEIEQRLVFPSSYGPF